MDTDQCACVPTCVSLRPHGLHPPGSSVYGIFQARILEWVAISSSKFSSPPRNLTPVSCISWIAGRGGFFTTELQGKPSTLFFLPVFIWLYQVLFAACRLLVVAYIQDIFPWPGVEPRPPALGGGAWSLSYYTTREVPRPIIFKCL